MMGWSKALANVTAQAAAAPCPRAPLDIVHSSKVFSPSPLCKAEKMHLVEIEGGFKERWFSRGAASRKGHQQTARGSPASIKKLLFR